MTTDHGAVVPGVVDLQIEIKTSEMEKKVKNFDDVLTPLGKDVYAQMDMIPKEWLDE